MTSRPPLLRAVAIALTATFGLLGLVYGFERFRLDWRRNATWYNDGPIEGPSWLKFESEGILRPSSVTAERATIADEEPVIGVVVGQSARAYRLAALRERAEHLVNDVVAGTPVSVTYCDLSDCARVFTGTGDEPLPIRLEGLRDGAMVLKVGPTFYLQETGVAVDVGEDTSPFPFAGLPLTRTTWGDWKRKHPDTSLYQGASQVR